MFKILVLACIAALTSAIPDQAKIRFMEATGAGSFVERFIERLEGRLAYSPISDCPASGSTLSAAEKDEFLTAHNTYRSQESSAMGNLTWSDALAKRAQDLVDKACEKCPVQSGGIKCSMKHGELKCGSKRMGQNAYIHWSHKQPSKVKITPGKKVVGSWHSEIQSYDYATHNCSKVCGHYTQVVWEKTKEVGCAARVCGNSGPTSRFTVCNYYPAGNYKGVRPYKLVGSCPLGQGLNGEGFQAVLKHAASTCGACPVNTYNNDAGSTCISCEHGYHTSGSTGATSCTKVPCKVAGCVTCVQNGKGDKCETCEAGHVNKNRGKECQFQPPCMVEGCVTCRQDGKGDKCETCEAGHVNKNRGTECQFQPPCMVEGCVTCVQDGKGDKCETCEAGLVNKNRKKKCELQCPFDNCEECTKNGKKCLVCKAGYTLVAKNDCQLA